MDSMRMANLEWRLSSCGISENGELIMETFFMLALLEWRIENGECLHMESVRIREWRLSLCRQHDNSELIVEIIF